MSNTLTLNELTDFHRFIGERLTKDAEAMSPEEALDHWRRENPSPDDHASNVAAVREAIADMQAGDTGRPAKEVLREICEQL